MMTKRVTPTTISVLGRHDRKNVITRPATAYSDRISPHQMPNPWNMANRKSAPSLRHRILLLRLSDRSPPTRNSDTPNNIENRVTNLSWKKASMIQYEIAVQPTFGKSQVDGLRDAALGAANPSALTARIPNMEMPRITSSAWMRTLPLTGRTGLSGTIGKTFPACVANDVILIPIAAVQSYTD
jgi:hypothetical protein